MSATTSDEALRSAKNKTDEQVTSANPVVADEGRHSDRVAKRITVNLTSRAYAALAQIVELTGDSKTEAINKALQTYAMIQERQHQGGGAWLQDNGTSEPVQVRFY